MIPDIVFFLDKKVEAVNIPDYIADDPISIPHSYEKLQDIEITAFWTAMLAWGKRSIIINKSRELFDLMDGAPYDFILNHEEKDRVRFEHFKHRTFQYTDTLYFLEFFQNYYRENQSLEDAFARFLTPEDPHVGPALTGFHELFFSLPVAPQRTRKHVSTPERNSACKRLNMFLRWMVRQDDKGVDFGLWKQIRPGQLLIPLDVHVDRVARKLGLLHRKQTDWKALMELMEVLRSFDPEDPGKYDYALFGIGVLGETDLLDFRHSH
ncbi:MAG: TIGR02757 family protein [Lewinellaceae bacterium]|nr:TIGR02757 family protein [Lewinellaceae bacterium]